MAILTKYSALLISMTLATALFLTCTNSLRAAHHEKEKTTAADIREETAEAYSTLKDYTVEQRNEAIAAAQDKLEKLDARIESLQKTMDEQWQEMSEATRQKHQAAMKALREKRNRVAEWFGGLRHSSEEAWEEVKNGFAKSYDQLQTAFSKARDEFEQNKGDKQ